MADRGHELTDKILERMEAEVAKEYAKTSGETMSTDGGYVP